MESTIKVIIYLTVIVLGIWLEVNKSKKKKRAAEARRASNMVQEQRDYFYDEIQQEPEIQRDSPKSFWERMEVELEELIKVDPDYYDKEKDSVIKDQERYSDKRFSGGDEWIREGEKTTEREVVTLKEEAKVETDLLFDQDEGDLTKAGNQPHGLEKEREKRKLDKNIDPELLIIYSELLRPKYKEF